MSAQMAMVEELCGVSLVDVVEARRERERGESVLHTPCNQYLCVHDISDRRRPIYLSGL